MKSKNDAAALHITLGGLPARLVQEPDGFGTAVYVSRKSGLLEPGRDFNPRFVAAAIQMGELRCRWCNRPLHFYAGVFVVFPRETGGWLVEVGKLGPFDPFDDAPRELPTSSTCPDCRHAMHLRAQHHFERAGVVLF
jgi:hypothetical protein